MFSKCELEGSWLWSWWIPYDCQSLLSGTSFRSVSAVLKTCQAGGWLGQPCPMSLPTACHQLPAWIQAACSCLFLLQCCLLAELWQINQLSSSAKGPLLCQPKEQVGFIRPGVWGWAREPCPCAQSAPLAPILHWTSQLPLPVLLLLKNCF